MTSLLIQERPAVGPPSGLLVLHHGRGTDENDLLPIGDALDPERKLHIVSPRAPLRIPDWPGYHWYVVPRVGFPDPETFAAAYRALADLHDDLWRRTGLGPENTILAGFSMGTVMSYALGLGADRPSPAGILAFSGFVPTVEGWQPDLSTREGLRTFIAHGRQDAVIDVSFARRARDLLTSAGLALEYHESDVGHRIDAPHVVLARRWLAQTLAPPQALGPVEDAATEAAGEG